MHTIIPKGGLCNRLRFVFSHLMFCKKNNKELYVIWIKDKFCNGFYLDYFEPIEGVTFVKKRDPKLKINKKGAGTHRQFPFPDYSLLKLQPYMKFAILNRIEKLGEKYISIHIRRTDHIGFAKSRNLFTSDEDFIKFLKENSQYNIYIASDNKISYNNIASNFPNRVKFKYHNIFKKGVRRTTLQDSIIDLYMCIYSYKFKGSGLSSFSELIITLRNSLKN